MHNSNTIKSEYIRKEDAEAILLSELDKYLDSLGFNTYNDVNVSFIDGGLLFVGVAK